MSAPQISPNALEALDGLDGLVGNKSPASLGTLAKLGQQLLKAIASRDARHRESSEIQRGLIARLDKQAQQISSLTKQVASLERKTQ